MDAPAPLDRPRASGRVALGALLVLILVAADVKLGGPLSALDHRLGGRMTEWDLRDRRSYRWSIGTGLWFGQRGVILVGSGLLALWLAYRGRTSEPIVRLAVAVASVAVAVYAVKLGVARNAPLGDARHEPAGSGVSFPSGHTANAVLFWGLANYAIVRWPVPPALSRFFRWGRWIAPWAASIAMILLNYHWLTDLVAGVMIGQVLLWWVTLDGWSRLVSAVDRKVIGSRGVPVGR